MIGGQDFGFAGRIVSIAAFVLAAGLAAAFAAEALAVVLIAEADQIGAAAVVAGDSLSDHKHSLPNNLIWDTTKKVIAGSVLDQTLHVAHSLDEAGANRPAGMPARPTGADRLAAQAEAEE